MEGISEGNIEKVLVLSDLDPSEIAGYLIDRSRDSLLEKDSLYDQANELVNLKEEAAILSVQIGKYQAKEFSITAKKLESFYRSHGSIISKKIKLHKKEASDQLNFQGNRKLQVNLPVSQFGLFIRLAMQVGWFGEREVSKTFEFFSKNFSTSRALSANASVFLGASFPLFPRPGLIGKPGYGILENPSGRPVRRCPFRSSCPLAVFCPAPVRWLFLYC
ncbi:hypothetical protein [Sphingobacterium siyangense]|uniref:hypothetical protein n=1 Tax=Sphingobacterium siyangense TaxID=459529 RepID=UPI002FDD1787